MDFRDRAGEDADDLWITRKSARVGAYQKLADDCFDALDRGWVEDPKTQVNLSKVIQTSLKSVAEELGQLPTKAHLQVDATVRQEVVGVEPEDL